MKWSLHLAVISLVIWTLEERFFFFEFWDVLCPSCDLYFDYFQLQKRNPRMILWSGRYFWWALFVHDSVPPSTKMQSSFIASCCAYCPPNRFPVCLLHVESKLLHHEDTVAYFLWLLTNTNGTLSDVVCLNVCFFVLVVNVFCRCCLRYLQLSLYHLWPTGMPPITMLT